MAQKVLDYEGLGYYDEKSKEYIEEKISDHTSDTTFHITSAERTKLSGIASGAEVNQNAFSNVVVGSTTIAADTKTDSLTLVGSNVTLTPDATNDKVTIGITKDNVTTALGYTPPTTNTTYGIATSSALGLVKSGTDITVDSSGNVSVNDDSHNHTIANVDGLQTALDGKAASSHGNHVPTIQTASNAIFLRNDNTWATVTPANIGAAASSHGTHVSYGTTASALGTSSAGTATTVSRSDHVHALPALTSCTGTLTLAKGGTGATDAATARTNLGLGTAATYAATTSIASGGTGLITSGAVYTGLSGKAPTAHATSALTYGGGTATNYGHVKLSDNYTSSDGAASASVAASSKAVADAYAEINSNLATGLPVDYENLSYSDENNKYGALVTTTKTLYSTLNSRKFGDYGYLCFELLINGNAVRSSIIIPSNRFIVQGYTVELFYVDSINVQRWIDIMYASETSFYMIGSSNIAANNTRVQITGMKAKKSIDLYTDLQ